MSTNKKIREMRVIPGTLDVTECHRDDAPLTVWDALDREWVSHQEEMASLVRAQIAASHEARGEALWRRALGQARALLGVALDAAGGALWRRSAGPASGPQPVPRRDAKAVLQHDGALQGGPAAPGEVVRELRRGDADHGRLVPFRKKEPR